MALTRITEGVIKPNENYVVNNINSIGVTTSTNFKTGTSNLHNVGIEIAGINVLGADTPIGTGATIYDAGGAVFTGVVTATSFSGSGNIGGVDGNFSGNVTGVDATFSGNVSVGGTLTYEDVTNIDSVGIVTARGGIDCNGDIDVDGHTNLDNVSVAGVTTITGTSGNLLNVNHTGGSGAQGVIRTKATDANSSSFLRAEDSGGTYIGLLKYGTGHSAYGALGAGDGALYANSGGGNNTNITIMADSSTGYINFATGGNTERLRINSDGRIWINTQTGSSATELLRVENSGSASTDSRISVISGSAGEAVVLFGDDQSYNQGQIVYSNVDHSMRFHANAGEERLRITSAGKIGIGTDNPTVNLHSYHATTNTVAKFESGDSSVNIRFKDGDTTNEMGIGALGNDFIVTATSGGERLRVTSGGNIGIGTVTPQQKLDVRGNAVIGIDQVSGNPGTTVGIATVRGHHVNSEGDFARLYLSNSLSGGGGNIPTASIRGVRVGQNYKTELTFYTNETSTLGGANGDGEERLRITSAGKVGIGTGIPAFAAINSVSAGAVRGIEIFKHGTDTGSAIKLAGRPGDIGTKHYAQLGFSGANFTSHWATYNTSGTKVGEIVIGNTGNVGIGDDTPENKLKINVAGSNDGVVVQNTSTDKIAMYGARNGDATIQMGQWGSTASGTSLGVANSNLAFIYTTSYASTHPSALLIGNVGSIPLIFATSGTERLRIASDGQLTHTANKASGYIATFNQAHADNPGTVQINSPTNNNLRPAALHLAQAGTVKWVIGQVYSSTSDRAFHLCAGTGEANSKLTVTTGGYVGIGEASPDHKFHIKGSTPILAVESSSWATGVSAAIRLSYTDGNAREIRGHYDHGLIFTLNQGEAMRIHTTNMIGINQGASYNPLTSLDIRHPNGTAGNATKQYLLTICAGRNSGRGLEIGTGHPTTGNQNDAGVYYNAKDTDSSAYHAQHVWQLGGQNAMTLGNTGNHRLGIGEEFPAYPLDIGYTDNNAWQNGSIGNGVEIHNKSTTANTFAGIHLYATGNGANAAASHISCVHTANGTGDMSFANRHNAGGHTERMRLHSEGVLKVYQGVDDQSNVSAGFYSPQNTGYVGTQWTAQGAGFVFYMGELASGSSSNASSNYVNLYTSHHWGDFPRLIIWAHHRYYQCSFTTWTFGCYGGSNPSHALEQVESWGGHNGNHSTNNAGSVSVNHAGSVATYSGSPVSKYELTMSNTGNYGYTRWYIGVLKCGRGLYTSASSTSNVDSTTSSGGCVHLKTMSNAQMGPITYLSA